MARHRMCSSYYEFQLVLCATFPVYQLTCVGQVGNCLFLTVLGHFGHRHFGLGRFCLDIWATDVSATENAEGGRFSHNHKFCVWDVCMYKCVMHFIIFWNQICMWILTFDSKMHDNKSMLFFIERGKLWCILYSSKWLWNSCIKYS